ncbi:MAG: glycosyltransferase family A protein [Desulforhopalus sp.]
MNRCPLSVIIPTFNRCMLLGRAVESVICQTVQCSEIIIVDDGSTDRTPEVLHKLSISSKIPVRYYAQENKGPAAARNLGIKKARFPVIAFLDSDDHWHKRKLEKQYAQLKHLEEYQISHTYEKWLRRGQHLNQKKIHTPRHGDIFDHCLQLCAVGMSTVMMKKELFDIVGFFDEELRCCEDYDLWLRISCKYPFLLVDEPLTVKEGGREDQVSSQYRIGMDKMRIYSLKKLLDGNILNSKQYLKTFFEFKKKVTIFAVGCMKHNRKELGRSYLELIPRYEKRVAVKFPMILESLDE